MCSCQVMPFLESVPTVRLAVNSKQSELLSYFLPPGITTIRIFWSIVCQRELSTTHLCGLTTRPFVPTNYLCRCGGSFPVIILFHFKDGSRYPKTDISDAFPVDVMRGLGRRIRPVQGEVRWKIRFDSYETISEK